MFVAGYLRVSTQKQADFGVSIEMQRDIILKHAKIFELIEEDAEIFFYEDDGYSAKSLERPAMKQMMEDVKKGMIDVLLVYDQARISRDVWDIRTILEMLQKYHVRLKCLYDDVSIQTASDRFRTYMGSLHNQYERERICERTNDALKSIIERGGNPLGGIPPTGYMRDENKNFVIKEKEAKAIRQAFELAKIHKSLEEIGIYLRETFPGMKWDSTSVRKVLENKKYAGILEYKGKVYKDIIPPIISEEDFNEAQLHYRHKKRKASEKYYYDELVYCSKCNAKMTGRSAIGRNSQHYYYYRCPECNKDISQIYINKVVSGEIYADGFVERLNSVFDELLETKKKYQRRASRIEERYVSQSLDENEYLALILPLQEKLNEVNEWLEEINTSDVPFSELKTDKDRCRYAKSRIRSIDVDLEERKIRKIVYKSYK